MSMKTTVYAGVAVLLLIVCTTVLISVGHSADVPSWFKDLAELLIGGGLVAAPSGTSGG
jgi:hypothetical protein